jgi:arylamine N-acetyltransferase
MSSSVALPLSPAMLDSKAIERYLAVLGIPGSKPAPDALHDIVAAHATRIPFESISKLYRLKKLGLRALPALDLFLDGIERYHFGGTCYSNNYYLYALLATLGYDIKLCGADMTNPDVHMVSMVTLDGREYMVEVGYGAPFLSPLPRDLGHEYVVERGCDRYILKPKDAQGRSRLELHRGGAVKHGYLANPAPKVVEDFAGVIADSFRPAATFMNAVLLVRHYPDRSVVIHNLTVIEIQGRETRTRQLADRAELIVEVEKQFGIPRVITAEAIDGLGQLGDAWS